MIKFILKKLLLVIPILLIISFIIFCGLRATGIDPINFMVSPEMIASNPEKIEIIRQSLGLDKPIIIQYFSWLGNCIKGDLGYSFDGTPIIMLIKTRMPYTIELAIGSLVLSSVLGIMIGIVSAVRQNGIIDYIGRIFAVLGQSIPQFLVGIILIEIFSIKLGIFPAANRVSPNATNQFVDAFMHLFLPISTLTIGMIAVIMRYTRNTMLDILNSDYIKTARSKGIPEWKVYLKHGFRNAMKPVLVIIMFRIPTLIGGSVVIETVFSYPGIGVTMTNAIVAADYPTVMIIAMIIAIVMLICSFMIDVINALIDPRIRIDE